MKVTKTERKLIAALAELQMEISGRKDHAKSLEKILKLAENAIEDLCNSNEKLRKQIDDLTPKQPVEADIAPTTKTPTPAAKKVAVPRPGVKKDGTPKRKPGPPKKTATVEPAQPELPLVDGVDVSPGAQPDFLKSLNNGEDQ